MPSGLLSGGLPSIYPPAICGDCIHHKQRLRFARRNTPVSRCLISRPSIAALLGVEVADVLYLTLFLCLRIFDGTHQCVRQMGDLF